MIASNSALGRNDSNIIELPVNQKKNSHFTLKSVASALVAVLAVGAVMSAPARAESAPKKAQGAAFMRADPLAGDTWHAVGGTWPGTIVFNSGTKKVVLTPVGANAIEAEYSLSALSTKANTKSGRLMMKNAAGQVVEATFTLSGPKNLNLRFAAGQRDETYVRMNAEEEAAEKARLVRMLEEKQKAGQSKR